MPTDYDSPRRGEVDEIVEDSLEEITSRRGESHGFVGDEDGDGLDSFELPGVEADLGGEDLQVRVIPKQADEFTCSHCFLVYHQSRRVVQDGFELCYDCAG